MKVEMEEVKSIQTISDLVDNYSNKFERKSIFCNEVSLTNIQFVNAIKEFSVFFKTTEFKDEISLLGYS